jgi:Predicted RNA-binding protein, contains TRAM domain
MHVLTWKALSPQRHIVYSVFLLSKIRQGGSYEGRRGHAKGYKRYPVEVGEELEVDITEFSPKEEGIAKVQGLVVYVPNAKPGNHVKIRVMQIDGKAAKAEIIG